MGFHVAVVGATGNVGREIFDILAERGFPADKVTALASRRSQGTEVSFGDKTVKTQALDTFDFKGVDICLMSAGGDVSREWAPRIAKAGAVVIDNSSAFRMDPDVPLIVPEVNADAVEGFRRKGIIANPNCSTAQMVVALKPIHDRARIKRVVVATYQSVSGAGKEAMDELWAQTRGVYVNEAPPAEQFPKAIAFNLIPQVGDIGEDGATTEEKAIAAELRKLVDPDLVAVASCVRVPVFIGESATVTVEFERPVAEKEAWAALRDAPGITVLDRREEAGYATPAEIAGEDAVYVGRLRRDLSVPNGLSFWVVTDTLRKGTALNAVQVAEAVVKLKMVEQG